MKRYSLDENNIAYIKKQIDNYKWVSFDIFDTLVKRKVNCPHDVFGYIEGKYKIFMFKHRRILAEHLAYKFYDEPNIYNIYNFYLGNKSRTIKIELETEKQLLYANDIVKELYDYCVKKKKNIIITSDMYIPKKFLKEYLNFLGYDNFNRMYVSNELKYSKAKGDIYKYILTDLKISKNDIVHVGDNPINDIENAIFDTVLVK